MTSSSSSLSAIGSGGGRCGGGGGASSSFANAVGTSLYWNANLSTDKQGNASISVIPPKGSWTISAYAMSNSNQVAQATSSFVSN